MEDSSTPSMSPRSSRRHRGLRAAAPGQLAEHQVLGLEPREPGETLAYRVEAHQLRLHFAQLDGKGVQVLAEVGLVFLVFPLLDGEEQRMQVGDFAIGGEPQGQIMEHSRQRHDGYQRAHPQLGKLRPVESDRSRRAQSPRN